MKVCTICKKRKKKSEFFFRSKAMDRLHSQCKQCYVNWRRSKWKEYYHRHGSKYRKNALKRKRKIKQELRDKKINYLKDKACVHCGNADIRVLDFDHIDPKTKSCGIARAITSTMSWDNILKEIKKCQILCANCHKIKTAQEQGWFRDRDLA